MGGIPGTNDTGPVLEHPAGESKPVQRSDQNTQTDSTIPEPSPPQPTVPRKDSGPSVQNAFSSQFDMAQPSGSMGRPAPFHMMHMSNALPYDHYRPNQFPQGQPQRYGQHASAPMMNQMGHIPPFMGSPQESMAPQGYYTHPQQMPQYYSVDNSFNNTGNQHPQSRQNMAYYAPQAMMGQQQAAPYYTPLQPYHEQPPPHLAQHQPMPPHMMPMPYPRGQPASTGRKSSQRASSRRNRTNNESNSTTGERKNQNVVRGPPRKPRQSGHAIWVGNLPPQTELMSLVHHICDETPGLQSLFLISKSNCAFANFKDEEACLEAQKSLHDSKFQSVRLVCRLRRSSVEGVSGATAPSGPSGSTPASPDPNEDTSNASSSPDNLTPSSVVGQRRPSKSKAIDTRPPQRDRFFILKSLTWEDLELSVRTGVWATQSHNEESLNTAFKTSDNVYLIFSANKSGEYFGYARMTSEINQDPDAAIQFAPKTHDAEEAQLAKEVPTEANEKTPKGRIVDDSARGTIFWEVEHDDSDVESDEEDESEVASRRMADADEDMQTSGKPFNLTWLSTNRLPFYRTRGLRNPWNSNREVKIARDGTELEPATGRRLVGLFNYAANTGPAQALRGLVTGYTAMGCYGT